MADLKRLMTFTPQGRCFRAEHNGRRFLLLSDSRSGSWALYEQTPLTEPAHDADDPGALEARPVARSRRRRRIADDGERRLSGTLRGLGLIGFEDDLEPVEQRGVTGSVTALRHRETQAKQGNPMQHEASSVGRKPTPVTDPVTP